MRSNSLKLTLLALGGGAAGAVAMAFAVAAPAAPPAVRAPGTTPAADRCSALQGRQIAGATIEKATLVASGAKLNPLGATSTADICQVRARISPVAGSEIKIDIWLPADWNGKMLGTGGGGFNGGLSTDSLMLAGPVNKGYAALATDAGHDVSDHPVWALGHPEKVIDFGYRANHVGAVIGKAIVADYYGSPAKRAYFHGCSNGGRDALMLAQRYPQDYNGIVAGAPANDWTGLFAAFEHDEKAVRLSPGVDSLSPKLGLVHDAAVKQCDALDGVKDGLISNPTKCRFDPAVLQCKAGDGPNCLSKKEVGAFRVVYRGTYGKDGHLIMPGFEPGSEYQWGGWFTSVKGAATTMGPDFMRYMVYQDPSWDWSKSAPDRDYAMSKRRMGPILDANNPDLRPFVDHGGKLLMYHGWDDAAIPPENSIRYFEAVQRAIGPKADDTRLFMVPGMGHCGGGNGPSVLDVVDTLDRWVTTGQAPERMIASKYDNDFAAMFGAPEKLLRSRPVCAWPKTPHYRGSGSVDEASSFVCR